jgi:F-type H+-transporting ATPase subunit b
MTTLSVSGAAVLLAAGGGGLANIDWGLFLWTLVLFSLFAGVLARFGWKPLLKMIEDREKSVRDAVEGAQKANAEAEALLAQHQDLLRSAGRECEEILKKATQEADAIRAELVANAKDEAEGLIGRAREEIARETRHALVEARTQIADLAVEAASKIVVSSMTPEAQKKLVQDFVDNLPPLT